MSLIKGLKYRPEIDGLRAIAVISVVIYHADKKLLPGGFLGVDIFFVISGYLITGIIYHDLKMGTFSFTRFYVRRARRIIPALLFVTAIITPVAWASLMPADFKDFAQSLIAILFFGSNFLFYKESGYFEVSAELKPLLHTWSLSVEEQFYIFFPLVFVLAYKRHREKITSLILFACLSSFLLAYFVGKSDQELVFYVILTRAWELFFGSFCHFFSKTRKGFPSHLRFSSIYVFLGCLGVTLSLMGLFPRSTYPFSVLPSVIGTGLLLVHTPFHYGFQRILSQPPLVFLGLISYSVYLWHQPIFALSRQRSLQNIDETTTLRLILLTFLFGIITWKFIEQPFRNQTKTSTGSVIGYMLTLSGLLFCVGLSGQITSGNISKVSANYAMVNDNYFDPNYGIDSECEANFQIKKECKIGKSPEILVWGDSFAMHLVDGIRASNPKSSILQITNSNCPPILGLYALTNGTSLHFAKNCIHSNYQVIEYLAKTESIKFVVLSGSFKPFFDNDGRLLDNKVETIQDKSILDTQLQNTLETIRNLGKIPVLFSPTPQNGVDIGRCIKKAVSFEKSLTECDFQLNEARAFQAQEISLFKRASNLANVVWLEEGICEVKSICKSSEEGFFIYRDSGHLTKEGSKYLGQKMNFYRKIIESK